MALQRSGVRSPSAPPIFVSRKLPAEARQGEGGPGKPAEQYALPTLIATGGLLFRDPIVGVSDVRRRVIRVYGLSFEGMDLVIFRVIHLDQP